MASPARAGRDRRILSPGEPPIPPRRLSLPGWRRSIRIARRRALFADYHAYVRLYDRRRCRFPDSLRLRRHRFRQGHDARCAGADIPSDHSRAAASSREEQALFPAAIGGDQPSEMEGADQAALRGAGGLLEILSAAQTCDRKVFSAFVSPRPLPWLAGLSPVGPCGLLPDVACRPWRGALSPRGPRGSGPGRGGETV